MEKMTNEAESKETLNNYSFDDEESSKELELWENSFFDFPDDEDCDIDTTKDEYLLSMGLSAYYHQ